MDLRQYFVTDTEHDQARFIGDSLICYVPQRYEQRDLLFITDKVKVFGVFTIVVNGVEKGGLLLPALITMRPSDIRFETRNDERFVVLVFNKNDIVMDTLSIMQDDNFNYIMWNEFLSNGNLPEFITYNNIAGLFDTARTVTGKGISVDHSILELIYAHLYRDKNNLSVPYRNTDMREPPARINLHSVAYGPDGSFAKFAGSYAQDGYNAALLNQSDKQNDLEDLFRA